MTAPATVKFSAPLADFLTQDPATRRARANVNFLEYPAVLASVDASLAWVDGQANTIDGQQQQINGQTAVASAAALAASTHAAAAAASSTAPAWAAGTYAVGAVRRSTEAPFLPYTCIAARTGSSTTDPSADAEGWRLTLLDIPTGYPVQQPSGVFDFTGGYLPAGVSFSRASPSVSQAPDGSRVVVGPNQPEFEYDAVTGECLGVVPRAAATNLITGATVNDLTQAAWIETNATPSYSDGWSLIVPTTDNSPPQSYLVFSKASTALRYTVRVRVKQHSAYKVWLSISVSGLGYQRTGNFNPATGEFDTAIDGYGSTDPIRPPPKKVGDEWEIVLSAVTNAGTDVAFVIGLADASDNTSFAGDGTSGVYVKNVAFWQGYPGQMADLDGTVATRTEDTLTLPTSSVTANEGAVYIEFNWPGYMRADPGLLLSIGSTTTPGATQLFEAYVATGMLPYMQFFNEATGANLQLAFAALTPGWHRLCLAWAGTQYTAAIDGVYQAINPASTVALGAIDHVTAGHRAGTGGARAGAPLGASRTYLHSLTPGEMIAMTAGGN